MDLRQLQQFVMLAETGNFHRAAERLHMAQPPLSISIRKLEAELGTPLFERTSRGVRLTQAGQAALQDARRALFHAAQARAAVAAAAQGERGALRIGFIGSATYALLPKLIPAFRAAYPGIELVLNESTTASILDRLEKRQLDAGLVRFPVLGSGDFVLTPLENDVFVAAVPADSPHARAGDTIALHDLAQEPFIMHPATEVPNQRAVAMMLCQQAGFVPRVAQQAVQVQTIVSLVESGLGVALVPGVTARHTNSRVRFLALSSPRPLPRIGIALATRTDAEDPHVARLLRVARDAVSLPAARSRRRPAAAAVSSVPAS
ncbi:LysR family transcriptional regulator [Cupriavidus respiraculi]|uniref:HTH-type transcriptional regulator BenM n=1 Tax=Cupriavidus respiraculi TaxID=195930 RepID=A0ABN7Z2J7_9BURK|nr:LysR family transcriptional regulator [Cupriavidus respiraculi]CAG9179408.1 HTH-type transcriptional regulator BenM [Cupriavidus respiraculi]